MAKILKRSLPKWVFTQLLHGSAASYHQSLVSKQINPKGRDKMNALRETFLSELADVYDSEKQLVKALPKMAKAATHEELKEAFESHLDETQGHVQRLEQVFQIFGQPVKGKKCKAMQGLVEEGSELIEDDEGDAAIICAAQKVEHYEIASYGSLYSWAKLLGEEEAADLLEETLNEEKAADEKLNRLAESVINIEESQEEEEVHAGNRGRSR
jgi:ferritin-like metal-binding protein YciE